jgi:hypothetical protein
LEKRLLPEKYLSFLFKVTDALEKQMKPAKETNYKKRKAESLLSIEANLTHVSE